MKLRAAVSRRGRYLSVILVVALLVIAAVFLWASDKITVQGERTIYTVECNDGVWRGAHCTGTLTAGARYRFRALKPHGEVLFWTLGASAPSGKFAECEVTDGRNWTCKPSGEASQTITLQMTHGNPTVLPDGPTKPFHAVPKWRWWLLNRGILVGGDADN